MKSKTIFEEMEEARRRYDEHPTRKVVCRDCKYGHPKDSPFSDLSDFCHKNHIEQWQKCDWSGASFIPRHTKHGKWLKHPKTIAQDYFEHKRELLAQRHARKLARLSDKEARRMDRETQKKEKRIARAAAKEAKRKAKEDKKKVVERLEQMHQNFNDQSLKMGKLQQQYQAQAERIAQQDRDLQEAKGRLAKRIDALGKPIDMDAIVAQLTQEGKVVVNEPKVELTRAEAIAERKAICDDLTYDQCVAKYCKHCVRGPTYQCGNDECEFDKGLPLFDLKPEVKEELPEAAPPVEKKYETCKFSHYNTSDHSYCRHSCINPELKYWELYIAPTPVEKICMNCKFSMYNNHGKPCCDAFPEKNTKCNVWESEYNSFEPYVAPTPVVEKACANCKHGCEHANDCTQGYACLEEDDNDNFKYLHWELYMAPVVEESDPSVKKGCSTCYYQENRPCPPHHSGKKGCGPENKYYKWRAKEEVLTSATFTPTIEMPWDEVCPQCQFGPTRNCEGHTREGDDCFRANGYRYFQPKPAASPPPAPKETITQEEYDKKSCDHCKFNQKVTDKPCFDRWKELGGSPRCWVFDDAHYMVQRDLEQEVEVPEVVQQETATDPTSVAAIAARAQDFENGELDYTYLETKYCHQCEKGPVYSCGDNGCCCSDGLPHFTPKEVVFPPMDETSADAIAARKTELWNSGDDNGWGFDCKSTKYTEQHYCQRCQHGPSYSCSGCNMMDGLPHFTPKTPAPAPTTFTNRFGVALPMYCKGCDCIDTEDYECQKNQEDSICRDEACAGYCDCRIENGKYVNK